MEKVTLKCSKCGGTTDQDSEALPPALCPKCGSERVKFEKVEAKPKKASKPK